MWCFPRGLIIDQGTASLRCVRCVLETGQMLLKAEGGLDEAPSMAFFAARCSASQPRVGRRSARATSDYLASSVVGGGGVEVPPRLGILGRELFSQPATRFLSLVLRAPAPGPPRCLVSPPPPLLLLLGCRIFSHQQSQQATGLTKYQV